MSYVSLLDRKLTQAFNKLKDLARIATLVRKTDEEFDFNTGEATNGEETRRFKCVIFRPTKRSRDVDSQVSQMMFKTNEGGEPRMGDRVEVDGIRYQVSNLIKTNGYTSLIEMVRV